MSRTGFVLAAVLAAAFSSTVQAKEPLKLGAVYGLTKAISFLGIPEERALRMRVDQINAAGGIDGHCYGNGERAFVNRSECPHHGHRNQIK